MESSWARKTSRKRGCLIRQRTRVFYLLLALFLFARLFIAEVMALTGDNQQMEELSNVAPACFDADDWVMAGLVRYLHAPAMVSACDHP